MADANDQAPSGVFVNDFIAFLNDTRPDSNCPGCGTSPSIWSLCSSVWEGNPYGKQDGREFMEPIFHAFKTAHSDGAPVGMTTYAMFCTKCGHLEQIFAPVIHDWLQERHSGDRDD